MPGRAHGRCSPGNRSTRTFADGWRLPASTAPRRWTSPPVLRCEKQRTERMQHDNVIEAGTARTAATDDARAHGVPASTLLFGNHTVGRIACRADAEPNGTTRPFDRSCRGVVWRAPWFGWRT